MRFAVIKNGMVENVIVADQAFIDTHIVIKGASAVSLNPADNVGPGHSYDGVKFTPPSNVPPLQDVGSQISDLAAKIDALNSAVKVIDKATGIATIIDDVPAPVMAAEVKPA